MSAIEESDNGLGPLSQAFAMIVASEIGDKTFLIAAILAMRHDRLTVFAGAFGSLLVMSILSAAMGRILPSLIPKRYTQLAAASLFLIFGAKMMLEAREMSNDNEKLREEMREAEEEIDEDDSELRANNNGGGGGGGGESHSIPLRSLEEGGASISSPRRFTYSTNGNGTSIKQKDRSPSPKPQHSKSSSSSFVSSKLSKTGTSIKRSCRVLLGPVVAQAFILTFLGEWGDRSQIATIALAAAHSMTFVAVGTILGHGCCTALAVIAGRWVSTKISIKHVTLLGAVLFIVFGLVSFLEVFYGSVDVSIPIATFESR